MLVRFFAILFFITPLFSQTFINGFAGYRQFETNSGYSKIFFLDFNEDKIEDILLYGAADENVTVHFGNEDGGFSGPLKKFFYFPFFDIKPFGKIYNNDVYLLISRKERLTALVSFTKYGTVQLLNKHYFDSYPTSLSVADIENDGSIEALISGSNFNGLSIIHQKEFILYEKKILENQIFSSADFVDINYDGFADIAAVDLLKNELRFLINDQMGDFRNGPVLLLDYVRGDLSFADIGSDGIVDFIYSSLNGIQYFIGDSISSYENHGSIVLSEKADKILMNDFNADGINDLVYLNKSGGAVRVAFAENNDDPFKHFVNYLYDDSIIDIIDFGKKPAIAALSSKGKIRIISRKKELNIDGSYLVGGDAHSVQPFMLSGRLDICYLSSSDLSFNILLSNTSELFNYHYRIPLSSEFTNFKQLYNSSGLSSFIFYSKDDKLVEYVNLRDDLSVERKKKFYTNSFVIDVAFGLGEESKILNMLQMQSDTLFLAQQNLVKSDVEQNKPVIISSNVINAKFSNAKDGSIFYVIRDSLRSEIVHYFPFKNIYEVVSADSTGNYFTTTFTTGSGGQFAAAFNNDDGYFLLIQNEVEIEKYKFSNPPKWIAPIDKTELYFSTDYQRIYFYNSKSNVFGTLKINKKTKKVIESNIIESDNVNSYFVKSFEKDINIIVFTESQNGAIVIREIDE